MSIQWSKVSFLIELVVDLGDGVAGHAVAAARRERERRDERAQRTRARCGAV